MNGNNKIRARVPIVIMILAYVVIEFASCMMSDYLNWGRFLDMLPIILLGIYFLVMYKKQSVAPYLVFALTSLGVPYNLYWHTCGTSSWGAGVNRAWRFLLELFEGGLRGKYIWNGASGLLVPGAAVILMCIAIFLIVKGSKKSKLLLIIAFAFASLNVLSYMLFLLDNNVDDITYFLGAFALLILYAALILYAVLNNPAEGIGNGTQYQTITPNEALAMLKDKFDLGIITEEEYKAKRAEIISKL